MLEKAHQQYNLRPTIYPYNSRRDGLSKNPTSCPLFYQQVKAHKRAECPEYPSITGEHVKRNRYPSTSWQTENRLRFKVIDFSRKSHDTKPFLVTNLDTRRHNPQSKQVFHIHRLNKKPVCKVHTWIDDPTDMENPDKGSSIYTSSFKYRPQSEGRTLVTSKMKDRVAEGIVPFDQPADECDVKSEMLLPICETTRIPSAPHPHKYLLRRKKITPNQYSYGVFYTDEGQPRPMQWEENRRAKSETAIRPTDDRISITSLCGQDFTRRRYIPPPGGNFTVKDFNGGAREITSQKFDDRFLPFLHVNPII